MHGHLRQIHRRDSLMPGFCCKGTYNVNAHAEGAGALGSSKP